METKAPAFQFYPKQWVGDNNIMMMDWDVQGMHVHLMSVSWQEDEPATLPKNDKILRKLLKNIAKKDWENRIKPQLFLGWKTWEEDESRIINNGLRREYIKQKAMSNRGKSGAEARWKNGKQASVKHMPKPMPDDALLEDEVEEEVKDFKTKINERIPKSFSKKIENEKVAGDCATSAGVPVPPPLHAPPSLAPAPPPTRNRRPAEQADPFASPRAALAGDGVLQLCGTSPPTPPALPALPDFVPRAGCKRRDRVEGFLIFAQKTHERERKALLMIRGVVDREKVRSLFDSGIDPKTLSFAWLEFLADDGKYFHPDRGRDAPPHNIAVFHGQVATGRYLEQAARRIVSAKATAHPKPQPLPSLRESVSPELEKLWSRCMGKIKAQVAPESYSAWFEPTRPGILADGVLLVSVPNQFSRKCLIENYRDLIEKVLHGIRGAPLLVDFRVEAARVRLDTG